MPSFLLEPQTEKTGKETQNFFEIYKEIPRKKLKKRANFQS